MNFGCRPASLVPDNKLLKQANTLADSNATEILCAAGLGGVFWLMLRFVHGVRSGLTVSRPDEGLASQEPVWPSSRLHERIFVGRRGFASYLLDSLAPARSPCGLSLCEIPKWASPSPFSGLAHKFLWSGTTAAFGSVPTESQAAVSRSVLGGNAARTDPIVRWRWRELFASGNDRSSRCHQRIYDEQILLSLPPPSFILARCLSVWAMSF